jgi:hypothetical protein
MSGSVENDPIDDLINAGTQFFTGGLVGYNKGGIKAGIIGDPIMEGTKEITGAKAAEEANKMAREQFDKSVADANVDRQNAIAQKQRNQVNASINAGEARSSASKKTNTTKPLGDVTDFLGI